MQDLGERERDDPQVQAQRPVADVVVVPLDPIGDRGLPAKAVDLRPAGDPRLDAVAILVAIDLGGEQLHELGPLRARADQAHLAA